MMRFLILAKTVKLSCKNIIEIHFMFPEWKLGVGRIGKDKGVQGVPLAGIHYLQF